MNRSATPGLLSLSGLLKFNFSGRITDPDRRKLFKLHGRISRYCPQGSMINTGSSLSVETKVKIWAEPIDRKEYLKQVEI